MHNVKLLPPQIYLLECFDYYENTGALVWKVRPFSHFINRRAHSAWNGRFAGTRAGSVAVLGRGYTRRSVVIDGTHYIASRIIWRYQTGKDPDLLHVDHINGDSLDDRWSNLRLVTDVGNQRNRKINGNSASGVTGVCWSRHINKWTATIYVFGKKKHLGVFTDKQAAIYARKQAEVKYGFHPNHGRTTDA